MAAHNETGKKGEQQAADYLTANGYVIRHRNWRSGRKELDIVAEKDGVLAVVEVKTRRNGEYGGPEEAVTAMKIRRIVAATDAYLRHFAWDGPVRFDIIALTEDDGGGPHLEHIEQAFHPPVW